MGTRERIRELEEQNKNLQARLSTACSQLDARLRGSVRGDEFVLDAINTVSMIAHASKDRIATVEEEVNAKIRCLILDDAGQQVSIEKLREHGDNLSHNMQVLIEERKVIARHEKDIGTLFDKVNSAPTGAWCKLLGGYAGGCSVTKCDYMDTCELWTAPAKTAWKERPTEAGWYWRRAGNIADVVFIGRHDINSWAGIPSTGRRWAGPIEEPK